MARFVEEERKGLSDADIGGGSFYDGTTVNSKVLMPGNPERVKLMAAQWDEGAEVWDRDRGFVIASGTYKGTPITGVSHGIGGPSMETPLMNLLPYRPDAIIRVGTTGSLKAEIKTGDLIINDACVRLDGTSGLYVIKEYPAAANYEVTMALIQACENLGFPYHVGTGCTAASFYAGQARPAFGGYERSDREAFFKDMVSANVTNFEMEAATLLTLGRMFGVRCGMIASVVANRITGEWAEKSGEDKSSLAGAEALHILEKWDEIKKKTGKNYFFPELLEATKK
ncbi:MAG: nucleoside phosphorylase [Erysipelotrichaceae bacterium]|nr:nucleoside phosphorylase [Erysipelotrichaceae bacterium]